MESNKISEEQKKRAINQLEQNEKVYKEQIKHIYATQKNWESTNIFMATVIVGIMILNLWYDHIPLSTHVHNILFSIFFTFGLTMKMMDMLQNGYDKSEFVKDPSKSLEENMKALELHYSKGSKLHTLGLTAVLLFLLLTVTFTNTIMLFIKDSSIFTQIILYAILWISTIYSVNHMRLFLRRKKAFKIYNNQYKNIMNSLHTK